MLVVAKNTEQELLSILLQAWQEQPTMRCVMFRFEEWGIAPEEWMPIFKNSLKAAEDRIHKIYMCHDNDIFIISRFLTHKSLNHILSQLTPYFPPASLKRLATLFEVGVDWGRIKNILEKKIQNFHMIQAQQKQARVELVESLSREQTFKEFDKDLLSSLPMRRASREGLEILIVEDDSFSQKLVENALKSYPVSMTSDGQGAIMNYVHKAPDVLFLDIGLPDIDGHEVLRKIFAIDPDAYIIMLSGNGDKGNVLKAVELGAKGFVGKPFSKEKLVCYIEKSPFIQKKRKDFHNGHTRL